MRNKRIIYFLLICLIIILGLLSRKISFIPLFIGDALYGIMIFFIMQFIFIDLDLKTLVFISLLICYMVEFSQLLQIEWLKNIRSTTLGRLILGQGFLWSDIVSYTVGITMTSMINKIVIMKSENSEVC